MTSIGTVISYPIPLYANVPIQSQFYQPSVFQISAISLGTTTTVTTTANMNYVVGQLVRLLIPPSFGCTQLNNVAGYVLSLPSQAQVEIAINSSQNINAFISSPAATKAQIIAVGDINSGAINASGNLSTSTLIPGSFSDISPQ